MQAFPMQQQQDLWLFREWLNTNIFMFVADKIDRAKKEKRTMKDEDVVTACQASCTTGAIVFGDLNNSESKISKLLQVQRNPERPNGIDKIIGNPRAYTALEEIGVKPNVFYQTKVRNIEEGKEASENWCILHTKKQRR